MIKKCLSIHSCDIFKAYGTENQDVDETKMLVHFKGIFYSRYSKLVRNCIYLGDTEKHGKRRGIFGLLQIPGKTFINYITRMEELFVDNIDKLIANRPMANLLKLIEDIPFSHPCHEFPIRYLQQLYVRMRIYYILKYANRRSSAPLKTKHYKSILLHK